MNTDEYLGVCITSPQRSLDQMKVLKKHVWVRLDEENDIIAIYVGDSENFDTASKPMKKSTCERIYPGIWSAAVTRIDELSEMDDGL